MKKEVEESCNKCDPIFVKEKIMCVYLCLYIYLCVQRKGSKRIFAKTVHSDNLGNEIGDEGVYMVVCMLGGVLCFYFCIV